MIEKILERLVELKVQAEDKWDGGASHKAYSNAISIVKEVAQEYGDGWIPCSERLPEPNKAVLVSTDTGEVDIDYYGYWCKDFVGLKGTEILALAWQLLPAPYQSKGELQ